MPGKRAKPESSPSKASAQASNKSKQKKSVSENSLNTKIYKPPANFYLTKYMEKIITQVGTQNLFRCEVCPSHPERKRRSIFKHLKSSSHSIATKKERNLYDKLIGKIDNKIQAQNAEKYGSKKK